MSHINKGSVAILSTDARTQAVAKTMAPLHFLVSWVSPSHFRSIMMGTHKVKQMTEKVTQMKRRWGLTVHTAPTVKLEISTSQRLSLMACV